MILKNEYAEYRQSTRFKVLGGAYVLFRSKTDQQLGFIVNISSKGLSFEYILAGETFEKNIVIDIISDENNIRVEKVPCKKIYELELEDEYYTPVQMHRVGVHFDEIESKQIDNLAHLVCDHI
jgi:hypothetical protein